MPIRQFSRLAMAAALSLAAGTTAVAQTTIYDFATNDAGFTPELVSGSSSAAWAYTPSGGGGFWSANGATSNTVSALGSPDIEIMSATTLAGRFTHNYNFEFSPPNFYSDGGILQYRTDTGGGFGAWLNVTPTLVTGSGYVSVLGFQNPLGSSVEGFAGSSGGLVTTNFALGTGSTAQEFSAGDIVQFRFTGGWDPSTTAAGPNWVITAAEVTFTPVPEPASVLAAGALATGGLTWLRRRR
ncbi:MAG: PEP-CTERM sorting domain-containing protein [Fimbriiglobus sp.]